MNGKSPLSQEQDECSDTQGLWTPTHNPACDDFSHRGLISEALDTTSPEAPRLMAASQPTLLEMFVREAAKSPLFHFERGMSMKEFLPEDGRAAGVGARTEAGDKEIRADLVIGADGRSSAVRRHAGFTAHSVSPPMDIVWFKLPCLVGRTGSGRCGCAFRQPIREASSRRMVSAFLHGVTEVRLGV